MARFKVKEEVMARWPGSALYFRGWVVDFNDTEYQIRFDDEAKSEFVVKNRDVRRPFVESKRSNSKGRSRSRGRSSSKGRVSSKGRSPARNKSPGRPKSSPARTKSPGRSRKTEKQAEKQTEIITTTTTTTTEEVTRLTRSAREPDLLMVEKNDSQLSSVRTRMSRADLHTPRTSTPTRQSPRLTAMNEKVNDVEVNNVKAKESAVKAVTASPAKGGGVGSRLCGLTCSVGSFLKSVLCALVPSLATITTIPLIAITFALPVVLNEMCTKSKCTVMEFPSIPQSVQYYYDPLAIAMVAGFVVVQTLLCLLPIGKTVNPISGVRVRCNGLLAIVLTLAVVPVCLYLEYNILIVYSKFRHVMASSLVLGVILALAAYIHGHYAPKKARHPAGNTGSFLSDYFVGRERTPTVLSLDLKFVMFRIFCLAQILINVIIVVKDLQAHNGQYSPTMLLAAIMQIFYAANWIKFEDHYFTTYEYQRQGFGFFLIFGYISMPFVLPISTRYVLNHRTELEWYYLLGIALLKLTGYTISRGANNQKHTFRSNPSDPSLARLESLPTSAGTRLLVSGWWGLVRHPNYLGEILMMISWGLVCGFKHAVPWVLVGMDVLFLVARTYEVEATCRKKYGAAWDSYTNRVKCRLIPKVY